MSSDVPSSTKTLQAALHAATRTQHTNLNKTIIARLPLCLPPSASNPTAYYLGMLTFGHIFLTFEQAIAHVLRESTTADEVRAQDVHLLQVLSTEGMTRSDALNNDLETLSRRLRSQHPAIAQIEARVRNQAAQETSHILSNIKARPHLALAYTWTMYLALFNGGRFLYKQLAAAGPEFWLEPTSTEQEDKSNIQALSFWRFDTASEDPNAEELKLGFKKNFEQASEMLSNNERDEVVSEAVGLFELCLKSVTTCDLNMIAVTLEAEKVPVEADEQLRSGTGTGTVTSIWQIVSSTLLAPAYKLLNLRWARPMSEEVKAV